MQRHDQLSKWIGARPKSVWLTGLFNPAALFTAMKQDALRRNVKVSLQCVAGCCNVLQGVAVCCSVLQCVMRVTVCCIVAALFRAMEKDAMLCTVKVVLRHVAVCCGVLQCVAVCCSVLQCVAVCCNPAGLFTAMQQVSLRRKQDALCRKVKVSLQCVAGCCRVLQGVAGCCRVL